MEFSWNPWCYDSIILVRNLARMSLVFISTGLIVFPGELDGTLTLTAYTASHWQFLDAVETLVVCPVHCQPPKMKAFSLAVTCHSPFLG